MQAYQAFWQDSHASDFTSVAIHCTLHPQKGLCFMLFDTEQCWAFADLKGFEQQHDNTFSLTCVSFPSQSISSADFSLIDHLLPYLSGAPRQQALALYESYRPQRSKWLLGGVLLGMLIFAGVLWLFFWGQIQLRKQQLAITEPTLIQALGARQQLQFEQSTRLCTDSVIQNWAAHLYQDYLQYVSDSQIKTIQVFGSGQADALILPNGHLFLSSALVTTTPRSTLLALISHQEGHLRLNHRLESRIYEQGNRIFYRLWQSTDAQDFLLNAPLWVHYSRGQEAAADHWAFTHLNAEGLVHADFQGFAKYMVQTEGSVQGITGFALRHPMATDRLQSLDQRAASKKLTKQIESDLWRKVLKNCENESIAKQ